MAFVTLRGGWRYLPVPMTLGGIWAMGPDLPRLFREDFPNAPFAQTLASKPLREWLAQHADWFFFHGRLDAQPREYALHGLFTVVALYLLAWGITLLDRPRPRHRSRSAEFEHKARRAA
ncbi:MAG: hypothetical protein AAF288_02125 [Planctomycetota bacterium]